jgi:type VI secretion system secreted protein Hcp
MAVDTFIYFEEQAGMLPIEGETKDDFFKKGSSSAKNGAFELKDWSFEITNKSTIGSATGGAGGGKTEFAEFNITKTTDSASPAFFRNCVAGAHYKTVTLAMRKAGGDPRSAGKPFLMYRFGTVFTTKVSWESGDDAPTEKITFVYGTLEVEYAPQNEDGTMGKGKPQGWSQITNKAYP